MAELDVALGDYDSNQPVAKRNQTGETSALPSLRYVVSTAAEGASRSELTPAIEASVTSSNLDACRTSMRVRRDREPPRPLD